MNLVLCQDDYCIEVVEHCRTPEKSITERGNRQGKGLFPFLHGGKVLYRQPQLLELGIKILFMHPRYFQGLLQAALGKVDGLQQVVPVELVEDDTAVRNLTRQILETFGYTVIEAVDGEDAVSQFIAHRDHIDLVILDVIMPHKNGKEACLDIRELRPDMKCLFSSGYTPDIFNESQREGLLFIPKPIIPTSLLQKIRKILDGD